MVLCYYFHWNCLKEFAMDMSWLLSCGWTRVFVSFSSWNRELISHAMMCHQACCPDHWCICPPRTEYSLLSLWGSDMTPHGLWHNSEKTFLGIGWPWCAEIASSEVGSLSLHLSSSCSGIHGSGEISGDISKAQLLLSVSWSLLWHKDCVLSCPSLAVVTTQTSWCLGSLLCAETLPRIAGVPTFMWELLFQQPSHQGHSYSQTEWPEEAWYFYSSRTIYLHFWHFLMCWTSRYKLSDSHCTLQYFKNCSVNHCNLSIRALNWIQENQFWSASVLLSNCRWDTLVFLASFLFLCRTLIAILISL